MSHTATPPQVPVTAPTVAGVVTRILKGPVLLAVHPTPAKATLEAARLFASRLDVPVRVLTVVEPLPAVYGGDSLALLPQTPEEYRLREIDALMRPKIEQAWGNSVDWRLDVVFGSPARVITDEARRQGASMIVIGKGKRSTIDRLFGGEVTLRVAMLANMPVFAVADNFERVSHRAIVAIDFSVASFVAARTAVALLEPRHGKPSQLMLVHVRPPAPIGIRDWEENYDRAVGVRLARFVGLLDLQDRTDVQVTTHILDGEVVETLLDTSSESGADLLAAGTRGPGWWERTIIGSTAKGVLRRATHSVLIAPPPPPAERIRLELLIDGRATLEESSDWEEALEAFTERNRGRQARLEIAHAPTSGTSVQADDLCFRGATYDPKSGCLSIMLSDDTQLMEHLTHTVSHVRSVDLVAGSDGRDRALLVEDARGHAVLTLS